MTPTAFPDWRRPHLFTPHTVKEGLDRVGRSPAWLGAPGSNVFVPSMCPRVGAEGSCFLELQYPTLGSRAASCVHKRPVAPSFWPVLTEPVLQLGLGAVPGPSMVKLPAWGKADVLWSPSLPGLGLGFSASFLLTQGFSAPGAQAEGTVRFGSSPHPFS